MFPRFEDITRRAANEKLADDAQAAADRLLVQLTRERRLRAARRMHAEPMRETMRQRNGNYR
jgi:hypothetical protein